MRKYLLIIAAELMVLASIPVSANADSLTYTGVEVWRGAIDGIDLTGQTATITIKFADGLVATQGAGGVVYNLGVIYSATYEFSATGLFGVDSPQSNLEFGSPQGFELSFFDEDFDFGMLSGTTAGHIGLDPLIGESLQDLFTRLGDGTNISFTQSSNFQMLNGVIGPLNGGASLVTEDIIGLGLSSVNLSLNTNVIPEPASTAVLVVMGLATCIRRRK